MRLLFFAGFILSSFCSFCQTLNTDGSGFYVLTEIGYGHGVGKINVDGIDVKGKNESVYFRLRGQAGYYLSTRIALGIGFGLDGYHNRGDHYNTAPLFLSGMYYLKDSNNSFYIFANTGYAVPLGIRFQKGVMGGVGLGKRIPLRKIAFMPSVGIHLQRLQDVGYLVGGVAFYGDVNLTALQFNLGIQF